MRAHFTRYLLVTLAFVCLFFPIGTRAQIATPTPGEKGQPFQIGEVLTYEAKFNRTLLPPMMVGDLIFSVVESPQTSDGVYLIKSEAQSRGVAKLFGKDLTMKLESRVDGAKFRILRSDKYDKQDERIRNSEAIFDYAAGKVTFTETDPNDPGRRAYQMASSIPDVTHDVISGIYAMRLMTLEVGKTINLSVSDSGLVYSVPVIIAAREKQKSIYGKVWTYRVEPQIFGENRPFNQKGKMVIWIMDDERRIPVRAEISVSLGKLDIKLKRVELTPKK